LQSGAEHSRICNGSVRPITLPSSPAEKLIYLTITNFLAVLLLLNEEQNEVSLILVQMEPRRNTETDGSSGRPVMSDEQNESSAKSVLTEVTRSNKRVLRGSIIAKEEMDATPKSEVLFNTTDGSSGRPVMSGEPSESSAKSVLMEVTRSNKRVLHGSVIGDEEMDATLKSEVVFNTTDGNPSGLRETSLTVPSASKKSKNSEPGSYTWMEVKVMTDNFAKIIQQTGHWTMYHGKLRTGQEVEGLGIRISFSCKRVSPV
jgi:hypothetical protein